MTEAYTIQGGVYVASTTFTHREEEYPSGGFEILRNMQKEHFWYRGRHRFLLHAVKCRLNAQAALPSRPRMVDLGGGCGGWVNYFCEHAALDVSEIALADSSRYALESAAGFIPSEVVRYQVDLLNLNWSGRWDVAFLLDVLEHIQDDKRVLQEIYQALSPGGFLFVTTPAIPLFWTWNDDAAQHKRRYTKRDFRRLAIECGYELLDVRYFMFLLSPLLLASRWGIVNNVKGMSSERMQELIKQTHKLPHPVVNWVLSGVFSCETPVGHWLPFPWGTSVLGVFRKPG